MSQQFTDASDARQPSRAQVRANRRNAQKSTGPRSGDGKSRSSRNAITHGLFCRDVVLPGESRREFCALRLAFHCDLRATDAVEFAIVERAVIAQWQMKRAQSAEADLHADHVRAIARETREEIETIRGLLGDENYDFYTEEKAQRQIRLAQIDALEAVHPEQFGASTTLAADFGRAGSIERLARHAHRVEHYFYKALRELRVYRKDKRDAGTDRDDAPLYADIAQLRRDLEACARDEEQEVEDENEGEDEEENEDDEVRRGVVTSATTCSTPNAQNEPNSQKSRAGDVPDESCEQGSRTIEPFAPTNLTPRGKRGAPDDATEGLDRS